MLKNASTLFGSRLRVGALCAAATSTIALVVPDIANAIVSAPPLISARREISDGLNGAFMSASVRRSAEHRAHDAVMRSTTAQIAVELFTHLRFGRLRRSRQQPRGGHDHAARAVAALRHALGDEGSLQHRGLFGRAEALDGRHRFACGIGNGGEAGADRLAVNQDRAGAALTETAAESGAREPEVTQYIQQRFVGIVRLNGQLRSE